MMFKSPQKLKTKEQLSSIKKYLAIYIATVCNFAFLFLWMDLSQEYSPLTRFVFEASLVLSFYWMFFVVPACCIAYGIISYKRTKKIIIPHFLLFLGFSLIWFVRVWIDGSFSLKVYFNGLNPLIIITMLSLIVSMITATVEKTKEFERLNTEGELTAASKSVQNFKHKLHSPDTKAYLITYLMTVLNFVFFLILATIEVDIEFGTLAMVIYAYIILSWLILGVPSSCVAYGIISYKTTKKIILPHFLLFIAFVLVTFVCLWFKGVYSLEDCVMSLGFPIAMTILSLIVSIITAIVQKVRKKQID